MNNKSAKPDPDNPEWTEDDFARARPAAEVHPELVKSHLRTRGPQKASTKVATTIRLDRDIVDHFKIGGKGWQTRLNDALREAVVQTGDAGKVKRGTVKSRRVTAATRNKRAG